MRDASDTSVTGSAEPMEASSPRRRQFLKRLAITPAVAGAAGCSLVSEGGEDPIVEDLEPGDTTGYPGAIRFAERYAMAVTRGAEGTRTLRGRFYHADRFLEFEDGEGNAVESYVVDGDGYVVTAGECIEYPDLAAGLESVAGVSGQERADGATDPQLTVSGRTTIDGQEMLVFELPPGELADGGPSVTYYVDEATRYLRRLETGTTTVDYHSWNAVDPIQPPDLECRRSD